MSLFLFKEPPEDPRVGTLDWGSYLPVNAFRDIDSQSRIDIEHEQPCCSIILTNILKCSIKTEQQ